MVKVLTSHSKSPILALMKVQKELHKTACFTGHRRLGMSGLVIAKRLRKLISKAHYEKGITHFIAGGALGFDMIAAEQVLFLKDAGAEITLEIAIPCQDHTAKWSDSQVRRLNRILAEADKVSESKEPYSPEAMMTRNKYMVSQSALVIAYYEQGKTGGTKNTLDYATKNDREIWYIK